MVLHLDEIGRERESMFVQLVQSRDLLNKAGYTAKASCRQVGRSRSARFHTYKLDDHEPMDGWTDGRIDRPMTKPHLESLVHN